MCFSNDRREKSIKDDITKSDPTQISPGGYIKNKVFPNNPRDIFQTRANLTNLSKKGL